MRFLLLCASLVFGTHSASALELGYAGETGAVTKEDCIAAMKDGVVLRHREIGSEGDRYYFLHGEKVYFVTVTIWNIRCSVSELAESKK